MRIGVEIWIEKEADSDLISMELQKIPVRVGLCGQLGSFDCCGKLGANDCPVLRSVDIERRRQSLSIGDRLNPMDELFPSHRCEFDALV